MPHHNDANDQDDCLNSVVARKHGDDEKMTPRARAGAMMKWINSSLLEGDMPKSRVATK